MNRKLLAIGLGLLLALGLAACNSDDDTALGVVSVYASASAATGPSPAGASLAAPVAGVSALYVTFDSLTLYNTAGEAVSLNVSGEVDLMSDADNLVGTFEIPAGDYSGLAFSIASVRFTDESTGFTCTDPSFSGLSVPRLQLNVPFLTVTDDGSAEVEIDLPVVGGTCDADGGTGSLQLSLAGASIRVR
ncbi:MAG: hypothetical protein Kow0062_05730 [Acidobacteriota bacterium]